MEQIKRKLSAAEEANREDQMSRAEQLAEMTEMRRKLEGNRKEFAVFVSTNVKTAERSAQHLKDEEARLLVQKTEISQAQASLNRQKQDAQEQLSQAASWRESTQQTRHNLQREREDLEDLARELQTMSDVLVERDDKFSQRERDIQSREEQLKSEKEAIEAAYSALQAKEGELAHFHLHADQQRMAMKQLEDELVERRVVVSTRQRELARAQQEEASNRLKVALGSLQNNVNTSITGGNNSPINTDRSNSRLNNSSYQHQHQHQKENVMQQSRGGGSSRDRDASKVTAVHNSSKARGNFDFEGEIASAKHTMQLARGGVAKISHTNSQRDNFLRSESDFLSKIQHRRI
jgi:hypothetical protein